MATFDFAQNLPEHVANLGCKTMRMINDNPELKKFVDSFKAPATPAIEDVKDAAKKSTK